MYPLGDSGIVVKLGKEIEVNTHKKVQELSRFLDHNPLPGMIEYVPAFTSVTIYYDCLEVSLHIENEGLSPFNKMKNMVEHALGQMKENEEYEPEVVEIPVCYGGEFGPDLNHVAAYNGLTPEEVVRIHSNGEYLTYMLGFAPGFPYLGGLSEEIATPRRESPRLKIPAGTVGIAGSQTGVYPIETPGGWQLIGRTPLQLFKPNQSPPTLLRAGNIIHFKPIAIEEYHRLMEVAK